MNVDDHPEPVENDPQATREVQECEETRASEATAGETSPASMGRQPPQQGDLAGETDEGSWREEVSARLHRYRARRRPSSPRYPSLRFKFEAAEPKWASGACTGERPVSPQTATTATTVRAVSVDCGGTQHDRGAVASREPVPRRIVDVQPAEIGKIIEFPRSSFAPPLRLSELAEAVIDRPRILEAPEVVPPPPALGGMTIEQAQEKLPERRPGIDMPLQSAPLGQRLLAAGIDAGIVLVACALFGAIAWRAAGTLPSRLALLGLAGGFTCLLWAAYQYLLIVHTGATPGLRLAKLRLSRFDGRPVSLAFRRWRVLASLLSGVSLGMGYAWHFFDEDALCWHDRVTRTYLAPLKSVK